MWTYLAVHRPPVPCAVCFRRSHSTCRRTVFRDVLSRKTSKDKFIPDMRYGVALEGSHLVGGILEADFKAAFLIVVEHINDLSRCDPLSPKSWGLHKVSQLDIAILRYRNGAEWRSICVSALEISMARFPQTLGGVPSASNVPCLTEEDAELLSLVVGQVVASPDVHQ